MMTSPAVQWIPHETARGLAKAWTADERLMTLAKSAAINGPPASTDPWKEVVLLLYRWAKMDLSDNELE